MLLYDSKRFTYLPNIGHNRNPNYIFQKCFILLVLNIILKKINNKVSNKKTKIMIFLLFNWSLKSLMANLICLFLLESSFDRNIAHLIPKTLVNQKSKKNYRSLIILYVLRIINWVQWFHQKRSLGLYAPVFKIVKGR